MSFQRVLQHQLIWFVLAISCNLYSLWRIAQEQSPLSSTDPVQGIVLFLLFTPMLWLGKRGWFKTYLALNTLFWLMIAYGGVGLHVKSVLSGDGFSAYASVWAWMLVVIVNAYGVVFSARGSLLAVRKIKSQEGDW